MNGMSISNKILLCALCIVRFGCNRFISLFLFLFLFLQSHKMIRKPYNTCHFICVVIYGNSCWCQKHIFASCSSFISTLLLFCLLWIQNALKLTTFFFLFYSFDEKYEEKKSERNKAQAKMLSLFWCDATGYIFGF